MASLDGKDELKRSLRLAVHELPKETAAALYTETLLIEQVSRERTPVDTGALRASHETRLRRSEGYVETEIVVGGPAAPYAIPVHEKLEVRHPVGQAKFLESAVNEAVPELAARVARRIDMKRMMR